MNRTVLPWGAMPARLPTHTTALAYLLLDRFSAPGWAWGVVGTFLAVAWVGSIIRLCTDKVRPLAGYGTL